MGDANGAEEVAGKEAESAPVSAPGEVASPKRPKKCGRTEKSQEDSTIIPILTRDTTNRDTYDIEYLMDMQKELKAKHRFATHLDEPTPPKPDAGPSPDFVRKNIEEMSRPKVEHPSTGSSLNLEQLLSPKRRMKVKECAELFDRLVGYKQQVAERCKLAREEKQQREISKCTFAPELVTSAKGQKAKRKPEDLYYEGVTRAREIQHKQDKLREELSCETSTFRPELNQQSVRLLAGRGRDVTPIYEKLYGAHKADIQNRVQSATRSLSADRNELTFKPSINKRAEDAPREKKVGQALYEDAQRRMEARLQQVSPPPPQLKASPASEKVLRRRFEQDFQAVWGRFCSADWMSSQFILRQLLQELGLEGEVDTCTSKIWEALEGTHRGGIRQKNLLVFLAVVLRLKPDSKPAPEHPISDGRFGVFQGDDFVQSARDVERVHKGFSAVYESHLTAARKRTLSPAFKPDSAKTAFSRGSSIAENFREDRRLPQSQRLQVKTHT